MTCRLEVQGDVKMTKELRDKILNRIIENWDDLNVSEKEYIVQGFMDNREDEVLLHLSELPILSH